MRLRDAKATHRIVLGETGNEVGHPQERAFYNDEGAIHSAKGQCTNYNGDGWWIVCDIDGREIDRGGKFQPGDTFSLGSHRS